jgi:MFS family permease
MVIGSFLTSDKFVITTNPIIPRFFSILPHPTIGNRSLLSGCGKVSLGGSHVEQPSMGNRSRRFSYAAGSWRRLRLDRIPYSAVNPVLLINCPGHSHIHHRNFGAECRVFLRRALLNEKGPRIVALTGGFLYGLGVFLAGFSANKLWWLYLSYGVIGGIGLGLAYIVPVAVLVKWFPDRRGLIAGIAVAGFGAGALVTAPLSTRLIQSVGVLQTFATSASRILS